MDSMSLSKKIGIGVFILQAFSTVLFMVSLFCLGMIPDSYFIGIGIFLCVLLFLTGFIQLRTKKHAIISKVFGLLISIGLIFMSFYIFKMEDAVSSIANKNPTKVDRFVVAVRKDDPADSINDARDYLFGIHYGAKSEEIKEAVDGIETFLGMELKIEEAADIQELFSALYSEDVRAIIINEAYITLMDEELSGISEEIKIIYTYEVERELVTVAEREEVEIENESFIVYISGIDVYGPIETNSRSDVNILAIVNPVRHDILLVTTPRDFYIPFPGITNGQKDKLTHAGIYGVDVSMAALGELYDIDPEFYVRVNFSSVIEFVDALGGITVDSQSSFTIVVDGEKTYVSKGLNHFDGKQTLAFCRERKQLAGGDNQRGKNQQAVIKALIEKMVSPAVLSGASELISSISDSVDTNMTQEQIQELIKSQINDPAPWNITTMAAEGTGDMCYCYSMPGTPLYVSWPNASSVEQIKAEIQKVLQ